MARTYGANSLSVVLTGMGQDGLQAALIREAGGQILVQDEATWVVLVGMPGHVARAGLADEILPVNMIGDEIMRRLKNNK